MRCVIYCRVSTQDQKDNYSLSEQEEMCRHRAKENGYQIVDVVSEDISGAKVDRPGMNRILVMAEEDDFDILLIADLDRFARSPEAKILIKRELESYGVKIEYVLKDFSDDPTGRLMEDIFTAIASHERELIRMRMMRGKKARAKAGNVMVSSKYGYSYVSEDHKGWLEIDPEESEVVKYMFQLYTQERMGSVAIARRLTQEGYKPRQGGEWNPSVILEMLADESYIGTAYWNRTTTENGKKVKTDKEDWIPISVPAIVSEDTFRRAQQQRKRNTRNKRRNRKHDYLLSGHITCEVCGNPLTGVSYYSGYEKRNGSKSSYTYRYYRCLDTIDSSRCGYTIKLEEIEKPVWEYILSLINDPDRMADAYMTQLDQKTREKNRIQKRIDILSKELNSIERKRDRLLDLLADGDDITIEAVQTRLKTLSDSQKSISEEIERLESKFSVNYTEADIDLVRSFCKKLLETELTPKGKRKVIELLDIHVTVNEPERVITVSGGIPEIFSISLASLK